MSQAVVSQEAQGRHSVQWVPAGWLFPAVCCVALAAAGIVALGRADLVVFAAPLVGALAGGWWTAAPPREITVRVDVSAERVFEGDTVTARIEVILPDGVEILDVELDSGSEMEVTPLSWEAGPGTAHGVWQLRAVRWGRADPWLRLELRGAAGLMVGQTSHQLPSIAAFPVADSLSAVPRPMELPDLLGVHLGRRRGEGVEFAGIRGYRPGDPLRSVNWPVTARRGSLYVTERLTEQAAKVVAVIDASRDVRQPGGSTLELSVQGALAVVRAALRRGDRAGVVGLGGVVRWMAPGMGQRHLDRVVEALIDVQIGGAAPTDATGFPPSVLPAGAAVVVFSPLVDDRALNALADLRRRGFGIAVVDVLRTEPRAREGGVYEPIAVRMWRVGRRGLFHRLAELGIPVVSWPPDAGLEEVLRPLARRPLVGARR
ncbi:MAG: DUF58 domain-containing protein [Pseudonocardia sp.]